MKNKILECLIYIQGDEGLTLEQIREIFNLNNIYEAKKVARDFMKFFNEQDRGLKVVVFDEVYKLATRETYRDFVSKLVTVTRKQRLSNAAIEVAGIVAYKGPVTRSQVSKIRGAVSDHIINTLLKKNIIREVGVAPSQGNPVLYEVTPEFYDHFKILSPTELPHLKDFDYSDGFEDTDFNIFTSQREDN